VFLPKPNDRNQKVELEVETGLVIVGANGSGKSRLGSWIELESGIQSEVHRISAQRSLTMPVTSSTKSYDKSQKELLYGNENGNKQNKNGHRWRNSPITTMLNDFALLMVNLFSEENDISTKFRQQYLEGKQFELKDVPSTKLDVIRAVWEEILPHRTLIVGGAKVEAAMAGEAEKKYNGADMSDGERVMFYLIGQSLCAAPNSVIIIDEPEVHLHQGIQAKLWDVIERLRDDCTFIYITHDLDFAASRTASQKICVKSYDGQHWDWFEVPDLSNLPDEILLEVVGSRKPVIFIEGDKGSLDHDIYSLVYPNHTLKPIGSCQKVIEATKSFNEINDVHKMVCIGIIDRDHRDDDQIQFLSDRSIFCPDVAEVENLFLIEDLLLKVGKALCVEESELAVNKIKDFVITQFSGKIDEYSSKRVAHIIDSKLKKFDGSVIGIDDLKSRLHELHSNIDIDTLYQESKNHAEKLIADSNYSEIIKVFNHKGIVRQIGAYFDVKPSAFIKKSKYLLANESNGLIDIVRTHMPQG
jgi:ABC-type cobalamin/Fe3+-siderophores transport system ATPase subunit